MRFVLFIFLCWAAQQLGAQALTADFTPVDAATETSELPAAVESPASTITEPAPAPATAPADGPRLAYREPTTSSNASSGAAAGLSDRYRLRRKERTLLGDLDLTGIWGGPTYNYSMTGDDWALVRGGFGGLEFSDEVFIGYGGWTSRESFTTDEPIIENGVDVRPEYDFRHGGFIIGYAPARDATVHPRFSVIMGPGRIGGNEIQRDRIFVGQAMAGVELNIFQWFRLGFEGGYRFAAGVEDSSPVSARDIGGAVVQIEARFGFSW